MKKHIHINPIITKANVLFITILLLCSCSTKRNLVGEYCSKEHYLRLNKNSTYYYQYKFGWIERNSFGKWNFVGKNQIEIYSLFDVANLSTCVKEKQDERLIQNEIRIIPDLLSASKLEPFLNYEIIVNGKIVSTGKEKTISLDKDIILSTIKVAVMIDSNVLTPVYRTRLMTKEYEVINKDANKIDINIPLEIGFFYYDSFNTDTLVIDKKKIYWRGKKDIKLIRCKQRLSWAEGYSTILEHKAYSQTN